MTLPVFHASGGALVRKGRVNLGSLTEFARREAMTIGSYLPDATNTGLLNDPARPLTVLSEGDYTVTTANTTIADLEIRGRLIISADNVTVDNCWVRGPATEPSGSDMGLIVVSSPTRNALIRDCYLDPRASGARLEGIRWCGYTAKRVRMRGIVDGFSAFNSTGGSNGPANATILGCWVEDTTKFYPDEGIHADGTHNDSVQVQGGSNITIRGNRMYSKLATNAGNTGGVNVSSGGTPMSPTCTQGNAIIQLNGTLNPIVNLLVEDNWFYGGQLGVNGLALSNASYASGITFQRNKFDRDQYNNPATGAGRIAIHSAVAIVCPTSGPNANVYMDDGSPVEVRRS